MRVLVTGGCGFIGSHVCEHLLRNTDWQLVLLDRLTYASNGFQRIRENGVYQSRRTTLFSHDCSQPIPKGLAEEIGQFDYILHLAAETHVDNSIENPRPFVIANVMGTLEMLEFARTQRSLKRFVYFSTDEVFGPAKEGIFFKEWDRYNSTNPYSAAKAGGEELCLAWANTYGVPVVISHCMNVFGERQHVEKFIPGTVRKILRGETVTIHSDPTLTQSGTRFYIHARNVAAAVLHILNHTSAVREKYNIVGEREVSNLELALLIAGILGKDLQYKMVDFHSSRPGHDLRYALDGKKLETLGWKPPVGFEASLSKTIKWYLSNPKWLGDIPDGQRGAAREDKKWLSAIQ